MRPTPEDRDPFDPFDLSDDLETEAPEPFRPRWLSPFDQQPYKLTVDTDIYTGDRVLYLLTPRVLLVATVDREIYESPDGDDVVGGCADDLVNALKRHLVETYGLEAAVRRELMRKLRNAAALERNPADRRAILDFLLITGGES